jgi:hypothetical protein
VTYLQVLLYSEELVIAETVGFGKCYGLFHPSCSVESLPTHLHTAVVYCLQHLQRMYCPVASEDGSRHLQYEKS